jgi:hypothetical protein
MGSRGADGWRELVKRPFGVTLLAIIFAAAGLSYIMLGFQMTTAVTFGPIPTGTGTWIWGWLIVLTGIGFWIGGIAAWQLQPFGWMLGQILAIVGIVEGIFALLGTGSLNYALATTAFPVILLWYMNRDSTKKAFGLAEEV